MRLLALFFAFYFACLSCLTCTDEAAVCKDQQQTTVRRFALRLRRRRAGRLVLAAVPVPLLRRGRGAPAPGRPGGCTRRPPSGLPAPGTASWSWPPRRGRSGPCGSRPRPNPSPLFPADHPLRVARRACVTG